MKLIACMKYALELDGVISSVAVGQGTKALLDDQKKIFSDNYHALRHYARKRIDATWQTGLDRLDAAITPEKSRQNAQRRT
jgi:hypothetical protein